MFLAFIPSLELERQVRQALPIRTSDTPSLFVPAVQSGKLPGQNFRLNGVEFRVVADVYMIILTSLTERPECRQPLLQVGTIGSDGAAVAGSGEILAGMKTKAAQNAECPHPPALDPRAVGLGRVFDKLDTSLRTLAQQFSHRSRLSV